MRLVIIESPYAGELPGDIERNLRYLRACMADCLKRGEAPFASHGLYTQPGVLDDSDPEQREQGIRAGFAWREVAHATVVYTDFGISKGMRYGINHAELRGKPIEYRALGMPWDYDFDKGSGSPDQDRVEMDGERSWYATERWGRR